MFQDGSLIEAALSNYFCYHVTLSGWNYGLIGMIRIGIVDALNQAERVLAYDSVLCYGQWWM